MQRSNQGVASYHQGDVGSMDELFRNLMTALMTLVITLLLSFMRSYFCKSSSDLKVPFLLCPVPNSYHIKIQLFKNSISLCVLFSTVWEIKLLLKYVIKCLQFDYSDLWANNSSLLLYLKYIPDLNQPTSIDVQTTLFSTAYKNRTVINIKESLVDYIILWTPCMWLYLSIHNSSGYL